MPASVTGPRTLYDKIWDDHVVCASSFLFLSVYSRPSLVMSTTTVSRLSISIGNASILAHQAYLTPTSRHLVHEVTSPQAFEGLCVPIKIRIYQCESDLIATGVTQGVRSADQTVPLPPSIIISRSPTFSMPFCRHLTRISSEQFQGKISRQ